MPLRKFLRPTIFLSGDKKFCSFTAILRRVILFRERGLTFADFWCEQGYKNETLVTTKKIMQFFGKH